MKKIPATLREAWRGHIAVEDYEEHMAAAGQAQANASLLEELFRDRPPRVGAQVLFAGAGTGQFLDYMPVRTLAQYRVAFADINPHFLARIAARMEDVEFATVLDDIETSRLTGPYDLAIVVLVLEHVDWKRAAASLARQASRVFTVLQVNPDVPPPMRLKGSMEVLREMQPALIDAVELAAEFSAHGFVLQRKSERAVRDGKTMLALDLVRKL